MKKFISVLTASTLVLSGSLGCSVYAYATDDLGALASSLGADTDYLNIPYITLDSSGRHDNSYYLTTMEVLVHNGELNVSDLQANTSKMTDVLNTLAFREIMHSECNKLNNDMIYSYAFKNASAKDKIAALLETAEKAYTNNEYFHIGYKWLEYYYEPPVYMSSDYTSYLSCHYATGIGITDGSWTFNGRTFDKCILTLDSVNTYGGTSAFSENTCIYINSETYDYYIPRYSDAAKDDIHIIAIDNDTMTGGDTSDLYNIKFIDKRYSNITITSTKDGIETVRNEENEYLDYCHNENNGSFFLKADSFKIDCDRYNYSGGTVTIENEDKNIEASFSTADSTLTFDGKAYNMTGTYKEDYVRPVGSEIYDYFSYQDSKIQYNFYGRVLDGLYFEAADNSFYIDANSGVRFVSNSKNMGNIFVSEKTEIKYDENGITDFYIDKDKDGIFEHKVETGDVNCDGMIDASDASLVLQAYSDLSTGGKTFLNYNLSDWDSNGIIDSTDASDILVYYAGQMTN